jgi:hypothetical protein
MVLNKAFLHNDVGTYVLKVRFLQAQNSKKEQKYFSEDCVLFSSWKGG